MVTAGVIGHRGPERLGMVRAQLDKLKKKNNLMYVQVGLALAGSVAGQLLAPPLENPCLPA